MAVKEAAVAVEGVTTPFRGKVCSANCCTLEVIDCSFPSCLGCSSKGTFICLEQEFDVCVPIFVDGVDSRGFDTGKHKILLQKGYQTCVIPPIFNGGPLCKGVSKVCCFESRISIPCDEEVPCMFGMCFIICFQKFQFKPEVFQVVAPPLKWGGAPTVDEMGR